MVTPYKGHIFSLQYLDFHRKTAMMHGTYNQINQISKMLPANPPAFCQMARWRAAADPSGPDAKILASSMISANSSSAKDGNDFDDPFGIKALERAGIILKEAQSSSSPPDSAISIDSTRTSTKASTWPFISGDSRNLSPPSSSFTSQSSTPSVRGFHWKNDTPIDMSSMPGYPSLAECSERDRKAYHVFQRQHPASFSREEHYRASQSFEPTSASDYEPESEPGSRSRSRSGSEDITGVERHDSLLQPLFTNNPLGDIWASLEAPDEPTTPAASKECRTFTPPSATRVVSGMGYRTSSPLEPFPAFDVTEMTGAKLIEAPQSEKGIDKKSKGYWRGLLVLGLRTKFVMREAYEDSGRSHSR
ncbi:uncharacterized protein MYCFIDRAFT_178224 [Pseudocercospora fijiensis CIRAD86]|uniref:Uncharacterized protein n=1 Tax=Pseudocercospora fijiensis (strain CIRAD86) TaxID=383855 RepID=M2YPG5_PSEFD|nr:uncharacterized protein MYCFIDRAFT_178224 [Pseudocercospora fijiensis CIRAD86]EME79640.1 hypothetical protein MYCFIDRAFT_178224 [Pseudocercospora fijiensis CIRAD86]